MKLAAIHGLILKPLTGTWFRTIDPDFWDNCTNTTFTKSVKSRFSPGSDGALPFEVMYLGETAEVTSLETCLSFHDHRTNHTFANPDAETRIMAVADVVLQRVAELTTLDACKLLETTFQELTGDCALYNGPHSRPSLRSIPALAPTQELGQALFAATDLEAFRTFSARKPGFQSLVVFPTKLRKGSSIHFRDGARPPKAILGTV